MLIIYIREEPSTRIRADKIGGRRERAGITRLRFNHTEGQSQASVLRVEYLTFQFNKVSDWRIFKLPAKLINQGRFLSFFTRRHS